MWKLTPRMSIFWKLSSRLIGLCNFYFAKLLIIWEINFSHGRVYSRSNTLSSLLFIIMFLVELIASSYFYPISKQARRECLCKCVLVFRNLFRTLCHPSHFLLSQYSTLRSLRYKIKDYRQACLDSPVSGYTDKSVSWRWVLPFQAQIGEISVKVAP